jgi:1-phosphofructokinase
VIATVTPNAGIDRTLEVARLRRGHLHRVPRATVEPGGKGINVARVLAAHGIPAHAVFPAGGSDGDALIAMLRDHRIVVTAVPIAAPVRVNVAVVEPGGEVTKLNEQGPELTERDAETLLTAVRKAARRASWVVSCGSLPKGLAPDFHARVVSVAHAEGARAALDTSGTALVPALAAGPDLVKPNRDELEEVVGWSIETFDQALAAARILIDRGAGRVLASFGSAGALLVDGRSALHGVAYSDQVQSTVGAGDALLAGFLAAEGSAQASLRQAVEWAAQSVASPGNGVSVLARTADPGVISAEIDPGRQLDEGPVGSNLLVGEVSASLDGLAQPREE